MAGMNYCQNCFCYQKTTSLIRPFSAFVSVMWVSHCPNTSEEELTQIVSAPYPVVLKDVKSNSWILLQTHGRPIENLGFQLSPFRIKI